MRSAVILAGGQSTRLGRDKGLLSLADKTIIQRVYDSMREVAEEVVIAVSSQKQQASYFRLLGRCTFVLDLRKHVGPLAGLVSGLDAVCGKKVAVVGCDMPFASRTLFRLLFELCVRQDAVIPRWPNGYIEPLHSVYDSANCLMAAKKALKSGHRDIRSMISHLEHTLFVSTETIREIDPDLSMFMNINTRIDLQKARQIVVTRDLRRAK